MNNIDHHRSLYQRTYPFLWQRLEYLVTLVHGCDANIAAFVLYGSVARGTAQKESDADLLILVKNEQQFFNPAHPGFHWLIRTEDHVPWPSLDFAWAFSPFVDQLDCRAITDDLMVNLQHDGILIYQQPETELPSWLARLQRYEDWKQVMKRRIDGEKAYPLVEKGSQK